MLLARFVSSYILQTTLQAENGSSTCRAISWLVRYPRLSAISCRSSASKDSVFSTGLKPSLAAETRNVCFPAGRRIANSPRGLEIVSHFFFLSFTEDSEVSSAWTLAPASRNPLPSKQVPDSSE